jgi:nitrite reductase/ring-hydroxylating ferredoxin subunit
MSIKGWYLIAFERDVVGELTPTYIGHQRLVLVREKGRLRAFDATCPHRGAHLAYGGRLCEGVIICPFHGHRILLGNDRSERFSVSEYLVSSAGGMVFVRLSPEHDNGWTRYLEQLDRDQFIVNGFEMSVHAPMETVIDNAFDRRHFGAVHGVRTDDFSVYRSEEGALIVESNMYVPAGEMAEGQRALVPAPYRAFVPSPGLAAVELRGVAPYTVITGASNSPTGGCTIRLSLAFPKAAWTTPPPAAVCEPLLHHSRRGLDADRLIWENLSTSISPRWTPEDRPSVEFLEFCRLHRDA